VSSHVWSDWSLVPMCAWPSMAHPVRRRRRAVQWQQCGAWPSRGSPDDAQCSMLIMQRPGSRARPRPRCCMCARYTRQMAESGHGACSRSRSARSLSRPAAATTILCMLRSRHRLRVLIAFNALVDGRHGCFLLRDAPRARRC
jgi:hypothetical protein